MHPDFLAAFRNLRGFRGEAKVSRLHRIAVNQCNHAPPAVESEDEARWRCRVMPRSICDTDGAGRRWLQKDGRSEAVDAL